MSSFSEYIENSKEFVTKPTQEQALARYKIELENALVHPGKGALRTLVLNDLINTKQAARELGERNIGDDEASKNLTTSVEEQFKHARENKHYFSTQIELESLIKRFVLAFLWVDLGNYPNEREGNFKRQIETLTKIRERALERRAKRERLLSRSKTRLQI